MAFNRKADLESLTPDEVNDSAFNRVVASASICEQSTLKMKAKLEASGFPDASVAFALDKACRLGVIDDRRYAECLVRSTRASGKGLRFIRKEIEALGIDIESLDAYQEYLDTDDDDEVARAVEYLERHPSHAKDQYASCQRKLLSRGFDYDIASQATKRFMQSS